MSILTQNELRDLLTHAADGKRVDEVHELICQSAGLIASTKSVLLPPVPAGLEQQSATLHELVQAVEAGHPPEKLAEQMMSTFGGEGDLRVIHQASALVAYVSTLYMDAAQYYPQRLPFLFPAFALACCESARTGRNHIDPDLL